VELAPHQGVEDFWLEEVDLGVAGSDLGDVREGEAERCDWILLVDVLEEILDPGMVGFCPDEGATHFDLDFSFRVFS